MIRNQILVRVRFDERSSSSAHLDHYYVDNVHLYFIDPNQPPVLTPVPDLAALVENELTHTFHADDIDLDVITITASNLPPGATFTQTAFDPPTALLSFTALVAQAGNVYTSQVYAVDPDGVASQSFTISVIDSEVSFLTETFFVEESHGTLDIPIVISRSKTASAQLDISGTATEGVGMDAVLSSSNIAFVSAGSVTQWISVVINEDSLAEGTELLILSLTNTTSTSVGAIPNATISIRGNDSFSIATANLVDSSFKFQAEAQRMLEGLKPDIIAAQEFNIANGETHRSFIDRTLGTNYEFYVENTSLPNGIVSRWPILASGWWTTVTRATGNLSGPALTSPAVAT